MDGRLNPVLADFGFVMPMPSIVGNTTVVTAAGALVLDFSRGYQAPEVLDGKHGTPSDVYIYGVVCHACTFWSALCIHTTTLVHICTINRLSLRLSVGS